jgi:L-aspartate oxidase
MNELNFNTVVIGSGLSGLSLPLFLDDKKGVAVFTKNTKSGSSWLAQGGISSVCESEDSFMCHIKDTLVAGCYRNNKEKVNKIISKAPSLINWIISIGVSFDKKSDGSYHLTKEGGHTKNRVYHVKDETGRVVQENLLREVIDKGVSVYDGYDLIDLIVKDKQCFGAVFEKDNKVFIVKANNVVIATGGYGYLFKRTTCQSHNNGVGIYLAHKYGAELRDMEYVQFHPTGFLGKDESETFLITEAARGEGAVLIDQNGLQFMSNYDDRLDLAPRDVTSRAIYSELKKGNHVFLNMTILGEDKILDHFPYILETCLKRGINPIKEPIPISPVSHYTVGGVVVDEYSETDVKGLFVVGEASNTGLHGANRLASNSLLECLYTSNMAAVKINTGENSKNNEIDYQYTFYETINAEEINRTKSFIRKLAWDGFGIEREIEDVKQTFDLVSAINIHSDWYYNNAINKEIVELYSYIDLAISTAQAIINSKESIGCNWIRK